MKKLGWFIAIIVVLTVLFNIFTFTVDETKKAIVIQYGDIKKVATEPGLYFKIPFIQSVEHMEDRLLSYDIQPRKLITEDKRRLLVNNYAIWHIEDPAQFKKSFNARRATAQTRIDDIVYSNVRNVLAENTFSEIASEERIPLLEEVTALSADKLADYGINLLDVRVKRADLPEANEQAVYQRMDSERQREASKLRAEGEERAREIKSGAERQRTILLSEARKEAETLRGAGEAKALDIYSQAYSQDPRFYEFWRTLDSYSKSFGNGNSTILLSPESDYMKLFKAGELIMEQGSSTAAQKEDTKNVDESDTNGSSSENNSDQNTN